MTARRSFLGWMVNVRTTKWVAVLLLLLVALSLGYFLDPFNQSPLRLVGQVKTYLNAMPYPFLAFSLFIAMASLALIPLNILLVAAALLFPGWKGFFCGLFGALLATFLEYLVGRHLISSRFLESYLGDKFQKIRKRISKNGLAAMIFLSLVPVAPHIVNNLIAGICRIKIHHLLIGSAIGLVPGLLVINILGRSVRRFIAEPNWLTAGLVVLVLIAMIWLMSLIKTYLSRRHSNHEVSQAH